jgi:hypothetical protein
MKTAIFVLGTVALFQVAAMAASADDKPTTQHPIKPVSWQELQGRCADPNNWPDLQGVVPSNIQIECSNVEHTWVPTEPGSIPLSQDRQIAAAVSATKFSVNSEIRQVAEDQQAGSCPRFKEVVRTSNIEVPIDCSQVLGFKGSPSDFCQNIFDSGKGGGPKGTVTQDTGRTIDSCVTSAPPGGDKPKPENLN